MKEAKQILWDLIIGIMIYAVIVSIIGCFFADNKLTFVLGVVYGAVIACLLSLHMFRSIDRSLDFDSENAEKYTRRMSVLRLGIMTLSAGIAILLSGILNVIGVLLGMLALKLSAYVQPIIHSYITTKIYNKGR